MRHTSTDQDKDSSFKTLSDIPEHETHRDSIFKTLSVTNQERLRFRHFSRQTRYVEKDQGMSESLRDNLETLNIVYATKYHCSKTKSLKKELCSSGKMNDIQNFSIHL